MSHKPMKAEEWYFVSLPKESTHNGHPTGQFSGFGQWIHPLLVEQNTDLVSAGITGMNEVKKFIHHYVKTTLVKQLDIQLTPNNRPLFPTEVDIRNQINAAKHALELSKLDQVENFEVERKL